MDRKEIIKEQNRIRAKKKRALNKKRKFNPYQLDVSSSEDESASEETSFNPQIENIEQGNLFIFYPITL